MNKDKNIAVENTAQEAVDSNQDNVIPISEAANESQAAQESTPEVTADSAEEEKEKENEISPEDVV